MLRFLHCSLVVLSIIAAAQAMCFIKDGDRSNLFRFDESVTDTYTGYSGKISGKISYGHYGSSKAEGQYFFVYYSSPKTLQVFTWNNQSGSVFEVKTESIGFSKPPVAAKFEIVSCGSKDAVSEQQDVQLLVKENQNYNSTFCFRVNGMGTSNTKLKLDAATEFGGFYSTIAANSGPVYGFRANPTAPMIVFGDRGDQYALVYIVYWIPDKYPYDAAKYLKYFNSLSPNQIT
jgi:hypothetical protein